MSAPNASHPVNLPHNLRLVVISGMSGAGKSVALHALEDAGYYCVDNLPPALLLPLLQDMGENLPSLRMAISMDARSSAEALAAIPAELDLLRERGVEVIPLFLDASNEIIMRRYSETRRKHPLTRITSDNQGKDLLDAIKQERILLAPLRERAHVIDTTMTRAAQLRTQIKELLTISQRQLTLVLESFAFKRGVPTDADYVFDVRMLPNPHYEPHLRPLTGCDQPVADTKLDHPRSQSMLSDTSVRFLENGCGCQVRSTLSPNRGCRVSGSSAVPPRSSALIRCSSSDRLRSNASPSQNSAARAPICSLSLMSLRPSTALSV